VPVLSGSVSEPVWAPSCAVPAAHPAVAPTHSLGCHRRRIDDRLAFDHGLAALMPGPALNIPPSL
ncbi:unnamed protein product, partial [Phaeothamnion confervicola]